METGTYTVTQESLEQLIEASTKQEIVFWDKELVVSYRLPNGFTVLGRAACVNPNNFDYEVGSKICRENAINELWQLEGYILQQKMHEDIKNKHLQDNKKQRTLDLSACFEKLVEKYRLFKG
jgi:hypothetical protein